MIPLTLTKKIIKNPLTEAWPLKEDFGKATFQVNQNNQKKMEKFVGLVRTSHVVWTGCKKRMWWPTTLAG